MKNLKNQSIENRFTRPKDNIYIYIYKRERERKKEIERKRKRKNESEREGERERKKEIERKRKNERERERERERESSIQYYGRKFHKSKIPKFIDTANLVVTKIAVIFLKPSKLENLQ